MSKLVTVFGATGNQGNAVVRALLQNKDYIVRAVTRQPDHAGKALAALGPRVEVVKADLDFPREVVHAMSGSSAVFCSLHQFYFRDMEYQQGKNLAAACKETKVDHLVFSGADHAFNETGKEILPWYYKEMSEMFLKSAGLPVTKVIMSWYYENLLQDFHPANETDDGSFAVNIPLEGKPLHMVSVNHAGRAVRSIIDNPQTYIGKVIGLSAGTFTVDDVVASLNKHCPKYKFYDGEETPADHMKRDYVEDRDNSMAFEYYQKMLYKRDPELTRVLDPDTPSLDAWVQENKDALMKKLDYEADIPAPDVLHKDSKFNYKTTTGPWFDWRRMIW